MTVFVPIPLADASIGLGCPPFLLCGFSVPHVAFSCMGERYGEYCNSIYFSMCVKKQIRVGNVELEKYQKEVVFLAFVCSDVA